VLTLRPMTTKSTIRAVLGCALGVAVLCTAVPARAGDTGDDEDVPLDTKIVRGILEGLGLKSGRESTINYQERPPLVIPPSTNLPPPEQGDVAVKNPAWPKDPDIVRAKKEAAQEKNRDIQAEIDRDAGPLSPAQMTPGGKPKSKRRTVSAGSGSGGSGWNGGDSDDRLSPKELGYKGGMFSNMFGPGDNEKPARFTGEPARATLTDPPSGYQTPSADQPYGPGKDKPVKKDDYYTEHGTSGPNK
jgi:hypothetical protein